MTQKGWETGESLLKLATRLRRLVLENGSLDGDTAAYLAQRLLAAEVQPGGPYRDETGVVDETLNRTLAALLDSLGVTLPNLAPYKSSRRTARSHVAKSSRVTTAQLQAGYALRRYHQPLRRSALKVYSAILALDRRTTTELSGLSERFGVSLGMPPLCDYDQLGAANLLVWIAYSLYDNILDGDEDGARLPVANAAHRDAFLLYRLQAPAGFREVVDETFRCMDEANAWELRHARMRVVDGVMQLTAVPRYGRYGMLARRAGAHTLGPRIIARSVGFSAERSALVESALSDYLVARQFNDDLHDWVDDFTAGAITPVVGWLIKEAAIEPGDITIAAVTERLRDIFWQRGLEALSLIALGYIKRARSKLLRATLMDEASPFVRDVLLPIQTSLEKGLARHRADRQFLAAFATAPPA